MALLNEDKVTKDVIKLLNFLEKSQWNYKPDFSTIENLPILTRPDLRSIEMKNNFGFSKTSGSTGEPVTVGKTYRDHIWYIALSIRELRWLDFDVKKNKAVIKAGFKDGEHDGWGIPKTIYPKQGTTWTNGLLPIKELQKWLEDKNPHYIHCLPSVFSQIDCSRISNFISWKGTGELGGTCYSSEECGIIAIKCPDNPEVYHVSENQLVERDIDGSLIITTLSNNYIKRYKHGDHIELGHCGCGRSLQTITKINGRVRNMMTLSNGDKKWPLVGSKEFQNFGIKRFKVIQTKIDQFQLNIISEPLGDQEQELKELVKKQLEVNAEIIINYVSDFGDYKFEEFVSLI